MIREFLASRMPIAREELHLTGVLAISLVNDAMIRVVGVVVEVAGRLLKCTMRGAGDS